MAAFEILRSPIENAIEHVAETFNRIVKPLLVEAEEHTGNHSIPADIAA